MLIRLLVLLILLCASPAQATVNEVFARNDYVGNNSTTSFPYTFKITNQADVMVILNGVVQTLNIAYTVVGVDNPAGGAVIFQIAPGAGANVNLLRSQKFQQLSIYTPNEAFPAKRIETDFDKNAMVDQRQEEEIGRALKFDPFSLFRNVWVDDPVAGKCLAWNAARTRVVNADCVGGAVIVGPVSGSGADGQATFWTGPTTIAGDSKFLWNNTSKQMTVGTTPMGALKPGNVFIGLEGPATDQGMQALMVQTYQGTQGLAGEVTLGADRVGVSSWNFRSAGATNPIYGANFGVVFSTNGVANGLEIDVQNVSDTNYQGQALWLNGSTVAGKTGHRANAILIDTQDGSKWERGILFKQGFVDNGATGSIEKMGIHFEGSQDADFIVIQPRLGVGANVAFKITNPLFTANRFEILNSGAVRVGNTMTGAAFPAFSFVEESTTGIYMEGPSTLGFAVSVPFVGPPAGVAGQRRMTLGSSLNIYPGAATPNNTGTVNLWDQFSAHSVGLMSPDFVGNSYRIRLPATPGFANQCLITDGAFPIASWSYAACGTGGPGGGVTAAGVLGLNQLVFGDGGSAVKTPLGLGTINQVLHGNAGGLPTWSGVAVADILATGTASATTFLRGDGQWAAAGGVGGVSTSGTPASGQITFFTAGSVISGVNNLRWDAGNVLVSSGSPGGTGQVFAERDYNSTAPVLDDGLGLFGFSGRNTTPAQLTNAVEIRGNVDGTGGARIKGRLTFHTSDGTNMLERMRINADGLATIGTTTVAAGVGTMFAVQGAGSATTPAVRFETTSAGTNTMRPVLSLVRRTTGGEMGDGLAPALDFVVRDSADNADNTIGRILVERSVVDGSGLFRLQTAIAGALGDRLTINNTGQMFYTPTTTTGTFGFAANGTRRTEVQFHTNSGANAVSFIAPPTATGNHVWTLPSNPGTAGQVLTNTGGGVLSWAAAASSGLGWADIRTFGASTAGTAAANRAAIQAAHDSLPAQGGVLYIPAGLWKIDAQINISKPVTVLGDGVPGDAVCCGGDSQHLGSVLQMQSTTQWGLSVTAGNGWSVRNIAITTLNTTVQTAGGGITATGGGLNNNNWVIRDVFFYNVFQGIKVDVGQNCSIDGVRMLETRFHGIWLRNTIGSDAGSCNIVNTGVTSFVQIPIANAAGIFIEAGGVTITGGVIEGKYTNSIVIDATSLNQNTGNVAITGNYIEGATSNGILLIRNSGTATLRNVMITGNEIAPLAPSNGINVSSGAFTAVTITGNTITNDSAGASGTGVLIQANMQSVVTGNTIAAFQTGINSTGNANRIGVNAISATTTPIAGTSTFIQPTPLTFAQLPSSNNGSSFYCSDCLSNNPCAGGGTGAFAFRLGSAWTCTGTAGNVFDTANYSTSGTIGSVQYFAGGTPGLATGNFTIGGCSFTVKGGIITAASGCGF